MTVTPPPDDLTTLASYPVVIDQLHNLLIIGCSTGAALGFWNGQTALGFLATAFTLGASALSGLHVHKTSVLGKILGGIQSAPVTND